MIYYDYESECWQDEKDYMFCVGMVDDGSEECDLVFKSQDEFYEWFYKW
jgi:hypothetical protein